MSFDSIMMRRLRDCGVEACREVERGLQAGRLLGDAVLDAIESLPRSETRELRRWVQDWEAFEEWKALEKRGWAIKKFGKHIVLVSPPFDWKRDTEERIDECLVRPDDAVVAAGADAEDVMFKDAEFEDENRFGKKITRRNHLYVVMHR